MLYVSRSTPAETAAASRSKEENMIGYGRSEIFCVGGAAGVVVDEEVKAEAAAGALLPPVLGVDDADERPDDEGVTGGVVPELLLDRNQRRTQRLTRPGKCLSRGLLSEPAGLPLIEIIGVRGLDRALAVGLHRLRGGSAHA